MPTPTSPSVSTSSSHRRASLDLMVRIGSANSEIKLRALRELKNQIIGNRTKKLVFLKLGTVPAVSCALVQAQVQAQADLLVQSAAALESFACDFYAGVVPCWIPVLSLISLLFKLKTHKTHLMIKP